MAESYSTTEPDELTIWTLPSGLLDVYVRHDIEQTTDDEGGTVWVCDERYIRTGQYGLTADEYWELAGEEPSATPTIEERITQLEQQYAELSQEVNSIVTAEPAPDTPIPMD